jgi:hypothetical protein
MHDINYFIKIKDEINEYIKKNTIVKLNELFFKLDKNLDIINIIITCFTNNTYENLTMEDFNSVKGIMDIEKYLTERINYNNIVLNLLTKANENPFYANESSFYANENSFYYNNLFTKINKDVDNDDVYKNYYNFSYYLHFNLNENGDFDLEIKDSEGRILSKENLETIINSLNEGENYD